MTRPGIAACALLATISLEARAQAPADPKAQARAKLEEGAQLYRRGDYHGALERFTAAQALYPSPKIHFNLGQAHRKLGHLAAAFEAFERFLVEADDAAPRARQDGARFLRELRPRIGLLHVSAAAGAEVVVDGRAVGVASPTRSIPIDAGRHQVAVREPGASVPAVRTIDVRAGETVAWRVTAEPPPFAALAQPRPQPPPVASPHPAVSVAAAPQVHPAAATSGRRWWPWAVAGAVVVGAGITTAVIAAGGRSLPTGSLGAADGRRPP